MYSYSVNGSPITSVENVADAYAAILPEGKDAQDLLPHYVIWEHNLDGSLSIADIHGDPEV